MNDRPTEPPTDEPNLLVAAYVDGEATSDERARVEADPALMTLVARYRAAKAMVADTPRLTGATRESILAAAVAEHSGRRSDDSPVTSITRPTSPSRGPMRWLGAAAAVVAVLGGVAFVASQLGGSGDDDAGSSADTLTAVAESDTRAAGDDQFLSGSDEPDTASRSDVRTDRAPTAQIPAPATTTVTGGVATDTTSAAVGTSAPPVMEAAGDSQGSAPPDDGGKLVRLAGAGELLDWYERVDSGALRPPGAGARACGGTILGWAQTRDGGRYVVVTRRPGNRLAALDVDNKCSTLYVAQIP